MWSLQQFLLCIASRTYDAGCNAILFITRGPIIYKAVNIKAQQDNG